VSPREADPVFDKVALRLAASMQTDKRLRTPLCAMLLPRFSPTGAEMFRSTFAAIAAACVIALPLAASADEAPDGTIELSGASVAAGVGYTWGKGTLRYEGRSIPVTFKGLSVAAVGGDSIRASGNVFHLTKLEDFEGNYTAASAGATVAGGGSLSAMENQKGVVIKLRSANQGLQCNLSVEGVAFAIAQ